MCRNEFGMPYRERTVVGQYNVNRILESGYLEIKKRMVADTNMPFLDLSAIPS